MYVLSSIVVYICLLRLSEGASVRYVRIEEEDDSQERGESYRYPPRVAADTFIHGDKGKDFEGVKPHPQPGTPPRGLGNSDHPPCQSVNGWGDIRFPQLENLAAQSLQAIEAIESELKRGI